MRRKTNNRKRNSNARARQPKNRIGTAIYSTNINSDGSGLVRQVFQSYQFGLAAAATLPLLSSDIVQTSTALGQSFFMIRPIACKIHFQPYFDKANALGIGSGVVAIQHYANSSISAGSMSVTTVSSLKRHKFIMTGAPYTMVWKPIVSNDRLWMPSDTNLFETVGTGFSFLFFLADCVPSSALGNLSFEWLIEYRTA